MRTDMYVVDHCTQVLYPERHVRSGYLYRYTAKKVSGRQFMVSDFIFNDGYKLVLLNVSLNAGCKLFEYLNSDDRQQRLKEVYFTFTIDNYTQTVVSYEALDFSCKGMSNP